MLAHVGPDPDPTFGDVTYDEAGRVNAESIADSILDLQRTRTEAVDPDTESLELLGRLARDLMNDPTEEEILALWREAVDRVSGFATESDVAPQEPTETKLNDAELLGVETDAFNALLEKDATLLLGEMWGAKDRRNTQDEDWKAVTMPWANWIVGGDGNKNAAAWGFSRHPVGKDKAGASVVLGSSLGGARKTKAMDTMFALGLDIDAGFPLDAMLDKLEGLGLFCLVYTSHSHGKSGLTLKHDEVFRKLKIKPSELTKPQIQRFLREHDKNRYEESFIAKVEITNAKKQTKEGLVIELSTPALDKYRLIFPLSKPVKIIDLADTQAAALEVWEDKITGMAREVLDVHFDTSCTDPSRLFYTGRHAKDAEDWYCAVVRGDPLKFEDVPVMRKSAYLNTRKTANLNAFEKAGGAGAHDGERAPQAFTPSGASLNDWHYKAKERFQMADLVEDLCADHIRNAGGEAQGHVHIECPFEHEHSSEGGTATMVVNALDSQNGYWTWFCKHDACQGRHKLAFLEEALRQQWFDEEQLFGDSVYMLEGPDDPDEVIEDDGEKITPSLDPAAPLGRTAKQKLASLSARFKLVNYKGKVLVIRNVDRGGMLAGDDILEFWTKPALKDFYAHEAWAEGEGKDVKWINPVDRWWTTDAKRHSRVVFDPSERPREYDVNLYNKDLLTLVPAPGDSTPIRDFIRDVICGGDVPAYNWVTLYLAHMVQRPAERPGTALVLYGPGGVGKGTFGRIVRRLVEPYDLLATHPEHLLGRFAGPSLATSMCVVSEEAVFGKSAEAADQLKGMVTQCDMRVEAKQVQSVQMDVFFRIIIDSNHDAAVRIEGNNSERRYMVLNVGTSMQGDRDAFKSLYEHIEGPAMAAYAAWLRQWVPASAGLDWSDVRTAPVTAARKQMFVESLRVSDKSFLRMLEDGEFVWRDGAQTFRIVLGEGENRIPARALDEWVRSLAGRYDSDLRPAAAVWKRIFGVELDRPKAARLTGERQTLDEGATDAEYAWQPFGFNTPMYHLPGLGVILDMIRDRTGRVAEVEN